MGKITVIKKYALPKLVYVLSSLPDPIKTTIKKIETIMYDFIWDSKPARIKRDVLTMDYEKGGKNDRSRNIYEIFKNMLD